MYNSEHKIIYIGKANSLKARVSSYFNSNNNLKTESLVKNIANIEYILTETPLEALVLEQDLIKQYKPKYNILLKDDKSYPYIMLSNEDFPRLSIVRGSVSWYAHKFPNATFFGPFTETKICKQTLEWLQKTIKLRSCNNYEFYNRSRPCLEYQIGRCDAPCVGYIGKDDYANQVDLAKNLLLKNNSSIKNILKEKMLIASKELHYEDAMRYRDMLSFVENVQEADYLRQNAVCIDIWGALPWKEQFVIALLKISDGIVEQIKFFEPIYVEDEQWDSVLSTYYNNQTDLPAIIRVAGVIKIKYFANWYKNTYSKTLGKINKKHLEKWKIMLNKNIEEKMISLNASFGILPEKDYNDFLAAFNLLDPWIVALDISHIAGFNTVGAMASFKMGKKDQAKTYKLIPKTKADDLESMYLLSLKLKKYFNKIGKYPDVIIVDGSIPQLKEVLKNLISPVMLSVSKGPARIWGNEIIYSLVHGSIIEQNYPKSIKHSILRIRDASHDAAKKAHVRLRSQTTFS